MVMLPLQLTLWLLEVRQKENRLMLFLLLILHLMQPLEWLPQESNLPKSLKKFKLLVMNLNVNPFMVLSLTKIRSTWSMEVTASSTRLNLMPNIRNGNSHLVMLFALTFMLLLEMVNLVKPKLELLSTRENLMSNTTWKENTPELSLRLLMINTQQCLSLFQASRILLVLNLV